MTEIKDIQTFNLERSIIDSGLAMRTAPIPNFDYEKEWELNKDKHIARVKRLVQASKNSDIHCHDNALVGMRVSFLIKYPQYLSPEMQRYHFFDIVTSMSKMHRLVKIELKKCCNKYTSPDSIRVAQSAINVYKTMLKDETITTFKYWTYKDDIEECVTVEGREEALYAAFMVMVSSCPLGLELWMRVSTNYKQLQTIYYQRRHHKLHEDWGAICNMIEELPYFKEFILGDEGNMQSMQG